MKTGLKGLRAGCFAAAIALMAAGTASAAADANWKLYTYFAANDKPTELHKQIAADIEKASGGRFKIRVFAAGELPYRAQDVLRAVATDQIEIGDVAFGFAAGEVPQLNALAMPFSCTSIDKFYDRAVPVLAPSVESILATRFATKALMQWAMPPQQLWLRKPVADLAGLRNLKIRSWNREQAELMQALGGSGVTITPAEVVPALERGVVDGAFTAAVPALDWKFNEVTKFGYMINLTLAHQVLAVNQAAFDKLPEDLKTLLIDKAKEWAPRYRQTMIDSDLAARRTLTEKGMTLRDTTPEETAKLRAASKPIWEAWVAKNGEAAGHILTTVAEACR